MPRRCCVPGCTSNYDSKKKEGLVSTFSFPNDENIRRAWIRAIPRKDWTPSRSSVVCAKHFVPTDIIRTERVVDKDGNISQQVLKRPKLMEDAIPNMFPNLPSYLSTPAPKSRTNPETRRRKEQERYEEATKAFMNCDLIKNYEDLSLKIDSVILKKWKLDRMSNHMRLYLLDYVNSEDDRLCVMCSIIVYDNLLIKVFVGKNELSPSDLSWILPHNQKLTRLSQLENILTRYNMDNPGEISSQEFYLKKAIHYIDKTISMNSDNIEGNLESKLIIIKDQLCNIINKKRQYNMITILFAFVMYCQSSSSYNLLRNYLYLPTKRYLQHISSSLNISPESNESTEHYLSHMVKTLSDREKYVNLLVDEIYIKSGLNYKSSNISGYAHNDANNLATTVQTFMISSAFGHFTEIVKLLPVKSLSGNDFKEVVLDIIKFVQGLGFQIICIITDNNRVNQRLFTLLSHEVSMPNPQYQDHQIYLLFDFVHIFKNVRNNWINLKDQMKTFVYPDFHTNERKTACFQHLRELYEQEKLNIVKKAYKLNNKSMFPNSLEKQNVLFVDNIFHHSTIAALKCSEKYCSTASFLEIIRQWWDIVNCKNILKGQIKRNIWSCPIDNVNDFKVQFLEKFIQWLQKWEEMTGGVGFTRDTFSAIKRSTKVICLIIHDTLIKFNMKYILLGKFQTDCLEKRFGWYRSLSGCNYNVSYIQIVESEKKIRIQHILKLKESKNIIKELSDSSCEVLNAESIDVSDFMFIITESNYLEIFEIDEDAKLYVCGYVAHSIKNKLCCPLCENSVVKSKGTETNSQFFNYLQKGGLIVPTDSVCVIFYHICSIFEYIINNKILESNFLKKDNNKAILYKLTKLSIESDFYMIYFIEKCQCGNTFNRLFQSILNTMCNIVLNNYQKMMNNNECNKGKKENL